MRLKRIIHFIIILCIFVSQLTLYVNAEDGIYDNLINNADLENADDSFCNPYISNFLGIDESKAHSGNRSVKTKVPSSWAHLVQVAPTTGLIPGNKYIVSFWYYTDVVYDANTRIICVLNNGAAITAGMSQAEITTGKWTKYSCIFTAQEGSDQLRYIYPAVVNGGPYSDEHIMWFDDFNLRQIPSAQTKCVSSNVQDCRPDSTEVVFSFTGEPDAVEAAGALSLNGAALDEEEVEASVTKDGGQYSLRIRILKQLAPLSDYTLKLGEISDMYGMRIENSEFNEILFKTLASINIVAWYCKTEDPSQTKLDSIPPDSDISLVYKLKNNTNTAKSGYLVSMICEGDTVIKVAGISSFEIPENGETDTAVKNLSSVPPGCYLRTFCWSSLDPFYLRAFNEIIELR